MTRDEAREKIGKVIPYLRHAMKTAKEEGSVEIGILTVKPTGARRVVCQFQGEEFVRDLCVALDLPTENTREEALDAAALEFVQRVEASGARIESTVLGEGEDE